MGCGGPATGVAGLTALAWALAQHGTGCYCNPVADASDVPSWLLHPNYPHTKQMDGSHPPRQPLESGGGGPFPARREPCRWACPTSLSFILDESARMQNAALLELTANSFLPGPGLGDPVAPAGQTTRTPNHRELVMRNLASQLWKDESGQGLAEYALLLGLIVIGVVAIIAGMGTHIRSIFNKANDNLNTADQ